MRATLFAATCLLGLANVTPGAVAAPQALLLVATGDDPQLVCERGECAAEVSTICLQPRIVAWVSSPKRSHISTHHGSETSIFGRAATRSR